MSKVTPYWSVCNVFRNGAFKAIRPMMRFNGLKQMTVIQRERRENLGFISVKAVITGRFHYFQPRAKKREEKLGF